MQLWRPCLVFCCFAAFAADGAEIYKWTDSDGVVHFSDQPVPGAEKIISSAPTSNGIGGASAKGGTPPVPVSGKSAGAVPFTVSIESPAKEQVFFNDDIIPVRLSLEPELRPGQSIAWHLNGRQLVDQAPTALAFSLQSLERGTYIIAATVTDSVTGETKTSNSVTFYMRQPSELDLQHRTR